jgi:hypothetical protein
MVTDEIEPTEQPGGTPVLPVDQYTKVDDDKFWLVSGKSCKIMI